MTIAEMLAQAHRDDLLTVNQFALIAQYDPETVYRKIKAGDIPGVVRLGRSIRINKVVALHWMRHSGRPPDPKM